MASLYNPDLFIGIISGTPGNKISFGYNSWIGAVGPIPGSYFLIYVLAEV